MKDKNNKKFIFTMGIVLLFLTTVSMSYAYFSMNITNNEAKDQIVETGTLALRYVDGAQIIMNNIKPGATITKTVYVDNTGTLDAGYNLVWQELNNEILNDEMVLESNCTRINATSGDEEGTCEGITSTAISSKIIKDKVVIEPGIRHKYDITITFKEINADQNYNQGKKFSGVLGVNEYKVPTVINCTFDGDMVQGAEYVNGQYTYRYMQEGKNSGDENLSWTNITNDGWGVQLNNKMSTPNATSNICTTINGKPIVSTAFMYSYSIVQSFNFNGFKTSNVTSMEGMFFENKAKTLDLSSFDTSNVTNMSTMFYNSSATTINLESFNTSKVNDMSYMFLSSSAASLDFSKFDTSKVTNMGGMFINCQTPVLDLSSFVINEDTDISGMFRDTAAIAGYAKDEATATKFNNREETTIPDTLVFTTK